MEGARTCGNRHACENDVETLPRAHVHRLRFRRGTSLVSAHWSEADQILDDKARDECAQRDGVEGEDGGRESARAAVGGRVDVPRAAVVAGARVERVARRGVGNHRAGGARVDGGWQDERGRRRKQA